jgi:adenosyl cobinamide kinase/adenosyl cobinamide phosphate guanylyltransferase
MVVLSMLVIVVAAISWVRAQQPDNTDTNAFMQVKLKRAQQVVEGLALERFDLIAKSAQSLLLMSNESNWNVFQTVEYNRLSREFQDSAARLRKAADEKNLDGATLAYFEVTLNCVRCHRYTRSDDAGQK